MRVIYLSARNADNMWGFILKVVSVYLMSMLKFILGPVGGKAEGLHILVTMVVTIAGMMTVVMVFTFFGNPIRQKLSGWFGRKFHHEHHESSGGNPRWRALFTRYGVTGIAFLTPVILTPIGGTLLAIGFGIPRQKIIITMLASACFWSVVLTAAVYFGVDFVYQWVHDLTLF
jgi:hypothetical protein